MWSVRGTVLEVRVPLGLLGFVDPSDGHVGRFSEQVAERTVVTAANITQLTVQAQLLDGRDGAAVADPLGGPHAYNWTGWRRYCYCERYKRYAATVAALFAELNGRGGPAPAFPLGHQFCECTGLVLPPPPPPPPPTEPVVDVVAAYQVALKPYLLLGCVGTILLFLLYAGFVRPLAEWVVPDLQGDHGYAGRRCLQLTALLLFLAAAGAGAAVFFFLNQGLPPLYEVLSWFGEPERDDLLLFALYVLSLCWDSLELLFATIFIRWPVTERRLAEYAAFLADDGKSVSSTGATATTAPSTAITITGTPSTATATVLDAHAGPSASAGGGGGSRSGSSNNTAAAAGPHSPFPPSMQALASLLGPSASAALTSPVPAKAYSRFFFVVAAHNSSSKLRRTIEHLLVHTEPQQIVIADNGSSKDEIEATARLCALMTAEYQQRRPWYRGTGINHGCIAEGSKTLAQLSASYNLLTVADYITLIDDDTRLPAQWSMDEAIGTREAAFSWADAAGAGCEPTRRETAVVHVTAQRSLRWTPACNASPTRCGPPAGTRLAFPSAGPTSVVTSSSDSERQWGAC